MISRVLVSMHVRSHHIIAPRKLKEMIEGAILTTSSGLFFEYHGCRRVVWSRGDQRPDAAVALPGVNVLVVEQKPIQLSLCSQSGRRVGVVDPL